MRNAVRDLLRTTSATRIHLFLATPGVRGTHHADSNQGPTSGAFAPLLGHRWNAMRPTIVYEHLGTGNGYAPTFLIPA